MHTAISNGVNAEKILRYVVLGGVFALPFVVLVISYSLFFPFITGKNFIFRAAVEVMFSAWIVLALVYPRWRPRITHVLLSVGVFVAIVGLADLLGENPTKSIWSNFERMEGLVTLVHLLAYVVVATSAIMTEQVWLWFWRLSLGVSSFVSLHALSQFLLTDKFRLDATLGNPIYLAIYVLFHIFIALVLLVRHSAVRIEQLLYAATLPLHAWVLYLTATRGATLGIIGGLMLSAAGVMMTSEKQTHRRTVAIGLLVALGLLVSGFFLVKDSAFVQESRVLKRFSNISLSSGTIFARTLVWSAAWEGFKERPLLGYGQENFNLVFNEHYDPRLYNRELWYDRTHNAVFDWLIAAGSLGLLAYLSIFLALLWTLYKTESFTRVQKWLFVGLLAAYAFHNLTVFDQVVSYILFFSVAAWIASRAKDVWGRERQEYTEQAPRKWLALAGIPVAFLLAVFLFWAINGKALVASATLLDALAGVDRAHTLARSGDIDSARAKAEESLEQFIASEDLGTFGTQEVREHLSQSARGFANVNWMNKEDKQAWYQEAALGLEAEVEEAPDDARFYVFLGMLHNSYGEHDAARDSLFAAQKLSPNKQAILMQLAVNAKLRSDDKAAVSYAREAWELETSNKQARALYDQLSSQATTP